MSSRAWFGFGVSLVASVVWWACSNSSGGGGGALDGGEAGEDASDVATGDAPACDPCSQFCACTPGEALYSDAQCMMYTCPPTGVWGALGCTGPSMCADASDGKAPAMDATTDATDAAADAPSDARPDAPGDAVSEALEASEASEASGD